MDTGAAIVACDRELASGGRSLYAREFSLAALNTRGFALVSARALDRAMDTFQQSLAIADEQVRPHIGLALVARLRADISESASERESARRGVARLHRGGRAIEALTIEAGLQTLDGAPATACDTLARVFDGPGRSAGWSIPIDPLFASLRTLSAYERLERTIAARASTDSPMLQST